MKRKPFDIRYRKNPIIQNYLTFFSPRYRSKDLVSPELISETYEEVYGTRPVKFTCASKALPDQSCILRAVSWNGYLLSSKQHVAEAFIPFASLRS